MTDLNFADIQGFILRSYKMPLMRHFVLRIENPAGAKHLLSLLALRDATPADDTTDVANPRITTAEIWPVKPVYGLNIGLTYEGLKALALPAEALNSFPIEFVQGAVGRAAEVGDVGANAPENWKDKFATPEVHIILFLSALCSEALEAVTTALRALLSECNVTELAFYDGAMLPGQVAHFGYHDGFSQPNVNGAPATGGPDPLPWMATGAFLLGYESQHEKLVYPMPAPTELGFNGSFMAYRVLEQDCAAFEQFLQDEAPKVGMSAEKLAAKMCGRWRNGVPLVLSPESDTPDVPIPPAEINNFDYVPTESFPSGYDDSLGRRCPLGSHIRRANPRSARVAGNGNRHRLMRRGLPYGPPYDPKNPDDGIERGLLGLFICASLLDQFEFLMSEWIEDGSFAPGLGSTKDPLLGANTAADSKFVIPAEGGAQKVTGFSQFITTRGGAYCFLPSLTALNYLANLP